MSGWSALDGLFADAPGDYSACVWRPNDGFIYTHAADAIRPAASLIKVPLAMAVLDAAHARHGGEGLDLETPVTLREEERVEGEGSFDRAAAGTTRTLQELIAHTIRESDNTAGNLLIAALGMDRVNDFMRAAPYRLQATCLQRRFMDFMAASAGRDNLTTAREMCVLFSGLLAPDQPYGPLIDWLQQARGDDKLVAGVPVGTVVVHKVGDLPGTTFVEHDAGIVYAPNGPYIVALLSANLPEPGIGKAAISQASRLIYRQMVG